MDRLDRVSIWAIVILIISSFALISRHMGEAKPDRNVQQRMAAADSSPARGDMDNAVKLIRNLMEADNFNKAEILIRELIQKYPYEGQPHMLLGDILMRKQEPVKAMFEYKEAVDLNADYLDKKTPLFQGKKLKVAVAEALAAIDQRIRRNPGDESLKSDRKIIYYLQRKIAGSCG
jgi:tetratricopeptide (TPR) repeat protein